MDVVRKTGIDQAVISRWLKGESVSVSSQKVRAFAHGYDQSVLECFVIAGFLTENEAGIKLATSINPHELTHAQLLHELAQRLPESWDSEDGDPAMSDDMA
jgi:hypothetical protein